MANELIEYLSKHTSLTDEMLDILTASTIIRKHKKGSILLKAGDLSNESYLVLKGCVRSYIISNGEEKTLEFYTEEQPILPIHYGNGIPSEQYLECLEDSVLNVNTPQHEAAMFLQYPQFESLCRIMSEVMLLHFQESLVTYKTTSAEERYLDLQKRRPDLLQRVPQYQLASYLGIKPESLSRIRRRLSKR